MTSVCIDFFRRDVPITRLHSILKQHAIIYSPPYDIRSILSEFVDRHGLQIQIRIEHSSRNINIVQPSISSHVLRVVVSAFQNHRLQMPRPESQRFRPPFFPERPRLRDMFETNRVVGQSSASSGKTCSICMDIILVSDLQILRCAHFFHIECIRRWSLEQSTCPECRTPLT